ncbi:hypothetical protein M405DRAFT_628790 [Rhizopogon salebrosus TDB-379]|nr:hypothetical protein M405DRAFT_628790 [Rhizopogon salebrosus TDB-379]
MHELVVTNSGLPHERLRLDGQTPLTCLTAAISRKNYYLVLSTTTKSDPAAHYPSPSSPVATLLPPSLPSRAQPPRPPRFKAPYEASAGIMELMFCFDRDYATSFPQFRVFINDSLSD